MDVHHFTFFLKMYKYVFQEGFHDSTEEVVSTKYFPRNLRLSAIVSHKPS
jgi:hypothetical protein